MPVDVAHLVRNNIYISPIRGEGKSGTHRAEAFMRQKRFDATLIHTHTFPMAELPEALRHTRERVEDAIFEEFANECRANPDTLKVANSGTGSATHLVAVAVAAAIGCEVVHLPVGDQLRRTERAAAVASSSTARPAGTITTP